MFVGEVFMAGDVCWRIVFVGGRGVCGMRCLWEEVFVGDVCGICLWDEVLWGEEVFVGGGYL